MVFEKFEGWTFTSPPPAKIFSSAWTFWAGRGYQLRATGGASFQGRSYQSKIGIHRVVDITVLPAEAGTTVHFRFRADVRADVAAGGVVVAVLLLPLAVVGAAVSWHEYERDWSQERWDFWRFLVGEVKAKPTVDAPPPPPPIPPLLSSSPEPSTPPRSGSHTAAPPEASPPTTSRSDSNTPSPSTPGRSPGLCPTCNARVTGEGRFCASCGAAIPAP